MAVGGEAMGMWKEWKSQPCCHRHQPPACRGLTAPCLAPAPALSPGRRCTHCLLMAWCQKPILLGSDPPSQIPLCQSQTRSPCNRNTSFGHKEKVEVVSEETTITCNMLDEENCWQVHLHMPYFLDSNYYIRLHVLTNKQTSSSHTELYKSV